MGNIKSIDESTKLLDLKDLKNSQLKNGYINKGSLNEGFEGINFPPDGWTVINDGDINGWERNTENPISGNADARIKWSSAAHDDWLITPALMPTEGNSIISFSSKQHDATYLEKFNVKLSTTGNAKNDFTVTLASDVGPESTISQTFTYDLEAYNNQPIYFAIQAISTDKYYLYIDDFVGPNIFVSPTDLVATSASKDYRLIPINQLDNSLLLKTIVTNVGATLNNDVNVITAVKNVNNETLFTTTDIFTTRLEKDESETIIAATPFNASNLAIGNYKYVHTIDYDDDYNTANNTAIFDFSVTEGIYARDAGVVVGGVGSNGGAITFGNMFEVHNDAIISGVQFRWPQTLAAITTTYQLALYRIDYNGNVLATVFNTDTYNRIQAQQDQIMNIPIRPIDIEAGLYVLAIKQTNNDNISMGHDGKTEYGFMLVANNAENPTSFVAALDFGNTTLRMDLTPRRIVTFNVTDGTNPITGATVTVKQGSTVIGTSTTNGIGVADIYAVNGNYTYSVSAMGYVEQNNVSLNVSSNRTVNVTMTVSPPIFEVTPTSWKYADTHIDLINSKTFTIRNVGNGILTINPADISLNGVDANQFTLTPLSNPVNLSVGQTVTFVVEFTPSSIGDKTATIQINDNLGKTIHSVAITGLAYDNTINAFPFIETFNNNIFPPLGWTNQKLGGSGSPGNWERVTIGEFPVCSPIGTGMASYACFSYPTSTNALLVTPRLHFTNTNYGVSFNMYRDTGSPTKADKVDVYVNSEPNIAGATLIGTINRSTVLEPVVTTVGWYNYNFSVPAEFNSSKSFVIIHATSEMGYNIFIDEFAVGNVHTVSLNANPTDGGTVTGSGSYVEGTKATLKAVANVGYKFINWTNEANVEVSTSASFSYEVAENVNFTANFATTFDVAFTVLDQDGAAVSGVSIAYSGTLTDLPGKTIDGIATTNASGVATVALPNGEYTFTATKSNYYETAGVLTVNNANNEENISIQIFPLVTFSITSIDNNPIQGAIINLNGIEQLTTNATGKVAKRFAMGIYEGAAYKIGYEIYDIDFEVTSNADTTINMTLSEALPTFKYTLDYSAGYVFDRAVASASVSNATFLFTNIGSGDLVVNMEDFTLSGNDVFQFSQDYTDVSHTLATGQTESIKIKFIPLESGNYTGQLIYNNNGNTIIIELSANAYSANTSPFVESFENGLFEIDKWFVINGTQTNQWHIGHAEGDANNLSAIVSNDGGTTNAYTNNSVSTVHFYADVEIPEGSELGDIKLYFDWKGKGEAVNWDYMRVFIIDPSIIPMAGNLVTEGQVGSTYNGASVWQSETINIPVEHFGITKRIVFTWRNDGGGGANPPLAVDNIMLVKQVNIVSVGSINDIEVYSGTELSELNLPNKVTVILDNEYFGETEIELNVIWDSGNPLYNGTEGEYQFSGSIQLPNGVRNDFGLTAIAKVTVFINNEIVAPENVQAAVINNNQAFVTWNTTHDSFSDDIESYDNFIISNIGNYTLVDVDGSDTYGIEGASFSNAYSPMAYMIFNPTAVSPELGSGWEAHSGNKYLVDFASTSSANNDWIISHQVAVVPGMTFSFWAKSVTDQYGLERFKVGVSTTGTAPTNFTFLTGASYVQAPTAWTQYSYNLDAYAGQQIYLAINCVSNDAFAFFVDDIFIGGSKVDNSKSFLGYSVYLNDNAVVTGLNTTEYTITNIPVGNHTVGVQSVYSSGSSEIVYANPITIHPADYNVKFTVKSGNQAVIGAIVTINNQSCPK